jgi:polyisoprenoid-binding protein YceI
MRIRHMFMAIALFTVAAPLQAEEYIIDTQGAHATIQFRIKHLGYSWLVGRFNNFSGRFAFDEKNPALSNVDVAIKTESIDSNHAERDKHLRGKDFLDIATFPDARFISTRFEPLPNGKAVLKGNLTLHGVTKPLSIQVEPIGAGPDPWGGYRRGFAGTTTLTLKDYGINYDLGPAARQVELFLSVEGLRKK